MNRKHPTTESGVWGVTRKPAVQEEFGYQPQPSGLPGWRHVFPHRSSSIIPEFLDFAAVDLVESDSIQIEEFHPADDRAAQSEQAS